MEFICFILQVQSPSRDYQTLASLGKKTFRGRIPMKGETIKLEGGYYLIHNICHTPDEKYVAELFVKPIVINPKEQQDV